MLERVGMVGAQTPCSVLSHGDTRIHSKDAVRFNGATMLIDAIGWERVKCFFKMRGTRIYTVIYFRNGSFGPVKLRTVVSVQSNDGMRDAPCSRALRSPQSQRARGGHGGQQKGASCWSWPCGTGCSMVSSPTGGCKTIGLLDYRISLG